MTINVNTKWPQNIPNIYIYVRAVQNGFEFWVNVEIYHLATLAEFI
jgi:hypothetical protein